MKSGVAAGYMGALILLIMGPGSAFGQLTDDDIQKLRDRAQQEGWTFEIGQNAATQYPLDELCGLVVPEDWQEQANFVRFHPTRELPSSFDWRDHNGVTPVRNQGGCGSCWAFAAIGAVEAAIKIRTGYSVDLSEQWLVSCTHAGSCSGGWHDDASRYMRCGGLFDVCSENGAVMESDFPYEAWDAPCDCPYDRPYCHDFSGMVGGIWGLPDPAEIKQAIYETGPVAVTVYVNSAFHAYNGGVFNGCEEGTVNHAVVLVGWDDNQGDGVWIMRNSWGPWWGEQGYMRIPYNCSHIGYAAMFVVYSGGDPINDACVSATPLSYGTVTGDTSDATLDETANFCGTSISAPGVWYRFTGTGAEVHASLCDGADWDTKLNIYAGPCGDLSCVAGNDDACGTQSSVTWQTVPGQTYHLLVQGYNGATGPFALTLSQDAPLPPATIMATDGTDTDRVTISWSPSLDVASYEVWRHTANDVNNATRIAAFVNDTSYDDTDLDPGITYWYWVQAKNAGGVSGFTFPDTGYRALPAPDPVVASDGGSSQYIQVSWSYVTNAIRYCVFRSADDNPANAVAISPWQPQTSFADATPEPETTYYYWVRASALSSGENPGLLSEPDSGWRLPATYDPGDMNCDGVVNNFDIDPFVQALTDPAAYNQNFPTCDINLGDINGDGSVNNFDIDAFVAVLTN